MFQSGFGYLAFLMAQIYRAAGILPINHPYLVAANVGRYGVRHVIAAAAGNLKFRKENIDQIIIFICLLVAVCILAMQLALLMMGLFTFTAHAAIDPTTFTNFSDWFGSNITPTTNDIAFILLDQVFGLEDMYDTCLSGGGPVACFPGDVVSVTTYPFPFHEALKDTFALYSTGLLVVATLIFVYFMVAVVAETAQSGTPFGQRFNHVWAPVRMVVAFGLLIPVAQGYNSGQWVVFYAAKWGSNFATNGWNVFITNAIQGQDSIAGDGEDLVAVPNSPPINTLLEFTTILATCKRAHEFLHETDDDSPGREIKAYLYTPEYTGGPQELESLTTLQAAVDYFRGSTDVPPRDIHITFGSPKETKDIATGSVSTNDEIIDPHCGTIRLNVTDYDQANSPGSYMMLEGWYTIIQDLWKDAQDDAWECSGTPATDYDPTYSGENFGVMGDCINRRYLQGYAEANAGGASAVDAKPPGSIHLAQNRVFYIEKVEQFVADSVTAQANANWTEDFTKYGWGGAAIWYNKIAQLNGSLIGAVSNTPFVAQYPAVMEEVAKIKSKADSNVDPSERFKPVVSDDEQANTADDTNYKLAEVLYQAQQVWKGNYSEVPSSGNIYVDVINAIFGTEGLFNIQDNIEQGIHPLAALSAIGKSLVESSLRNLAISFGAGFAGGMANIMGSEVLGKLGSAVSGFFMQVAMMGLGIGFLLFYVLPFLPFIYFFFAVGGWVKSIFEAMVGVPLWALAHIRIDGNGLPGDAAMGGYYLILEIFLRPIMIIFGFVGSIIIFSAQVELLQEIWQLVTSNVAGYDESCKTSGTCPAAGLTGATQYLRGAIDTLFFTVIFTIIVYMIGMSSFKLVDMVPNHILRWMGANVTSFGDQSQDPAENLTRNAMFGGQMVSGSIQQSAGAAQEAAMGGAGFIKSLATRQGS